MEAEAGTNSTRRAAAIGVILLGVAALWWLGRSGANVTSTESATSEDIAVQPKGAGANDPRLKGAHRFEDGGWIYVHLEGDAPTLGFQHGYLLGPEIEDAFTAISAGMTHETQRDWAFFRKAAHEMLWPKIDAEYQQELQGIVDGLRARTGSKLDVDDIVAMNAFVATGSWTKDGKIVMAHNNWTSYANGERWRIVFDIDPKSGHRILMDGIPGVIASDDDFGINDDGLMVTETTITQFEGWDPNGVAEFVRARKALQYASSIDEYTKIMLDGNNGGYANDWLLGDSKTGEIAQLELGLKAYKLWRTKDGAFAGSNWARDPKVIKADAPQFEPNNLETSPNARRVRWEELLKENKGKIDVNVAEKMLGDHVDSYHQKPETNERTLCGHVDSSPRGVDVWGWAPYFPGGAVQAKATDSSMTKEMKLVARVGHPCGENFLAKPFLAAHPEYAWQEPYLRDMKAGPWTEFHSGETASPQEQ